MRAKMTLANFLGSTYFFAFVAAVLVNAIEPSSPIGSQAATRLTTAVAIIVLLSAILIGSFIGTYRPLQFTSDKTFWNRLLICVLSIGLLAPLLSIGFRAASSGWIYNPGRHGASARYAAVTSPLGYWITYFALVLICGALAYFTQCCVERAIALRHKS
jgi:hypothetical protein